MNFYIINKYILFFISKYIYIYNITKYNKKGKIKKNIEKNFRNFKKKVNMYWKQLFNLKNSSVPATASLTRDKSEDFQYPTTPFLLTINSIKSLHIPGYINDNILFSPDYELFFEFRSSLFDTKTSTFFGQTWKNIDSRFSTNLNINKPNYKDKRRNKENRRKSKYSDDNSEHEKNSNMNDSKSNSDYSSNKSHSSSSSNSSRSSSPISGSESYSSSYTESDYSSNYDSDYSSSRSFSSNDSNKSNLDDLDHAVIKDRSFNIMDNKVKFVLF